MNLERYRNKLLFRRRSQQRTNRGRSEAIQVASPISLSASRVRQLNKSGGWEHSKTWRTKLHSNPPFPVPIPSHPAPLRDHVSALIARILDSNKHTRRIPPRALSPKPIKQINLLQLTTLNPFHARQPTLLIDPEIRSTTAHRPEYKQPCHPKPGAGARSPQGKANDKNPAHPKDQPTTTSPQPPPHLPHAAVASPTRRRSSEQWA